MKKLILLLSSMLAGSSCVFAQQAAKTIARPKLVVGIVVDQMRWDYLYRFYARYSADGFKRLLSQGYSCQNTMISYLPSFTAPGHSCIYTGSVPALHGIAANDWVDNHTGRSWYCTEDTTVAPVGGSYKAGMMSPRNLLATTVTDELRLATNFKSRVYGVSVKDRGSILPAGHLANGAFWYDDSTGNFMTSSYYAATLPGWLNRFNERKQPDSMLRLGWQTLYPLSSYTQSLPDSNGYEGLVKGETAPVFPHNTAAFAGKKYGALRVTPWGNALTLNVARACVDGEQLGQKGVTDFLCVSLSSTDYIGHQYAPNSVEIEDTYLRLDQELAAFLRFLDVRVGKGNYLLFLTADHGGAHNAAYLNDLNIPSGNISAAQKAKELNQYLSGIYGADQLVAEMGNDQVVLREQLIEKNKYDREAIKKTIMRWLRSRPEVAFAVDMESCFALPEPLQKMVVNGYNPHRSGCIQIILQPGYYTGYAVTGTTHGSWNPYDAHIPLLWYGWQIPAGNNTKTVYMTDIAATIAALLHVQMPNACVGNIIQMK